MRPLNRALREVATEPGTEAEGGSPSPASPNAAAGLPGPAGGSQEVPGDWRASLPEGLRGEKSLGTFKDVGALAQAFVETKRMQGQGDIIRKPPANATPEQLEAYRTSLGVPKVPSDYPAPALPEGEEMDQARWERWREHAHKLGLTGEQLTGLAALEAEERAGIVTAQRQEWARGADALKQEWGEPLFAKNVTLASRAIDRHMSPEGKAFLDASGLGNHPELIRAWASIGALLAEDGYIEGRVIGLPDPNEALAKIAAIRAQGKAHPANDPDHPQYAAAAQEVYRLHRLAYGDGPPTRGGPPQARP